MYNKSMNNRLPRNFQLTVANAAISRFGLSAYNLVIIWVILQITGKPALAGLADSMMTFPLMLSIVVGSFVDKMWLKKELAISAAAVRVILLFLILFAIHTEKDLYIAVSIFAATFILGFTSDVIDSVRSSWMKAFLREDQYKAGSSEMSSATMIAQGAGFILSGIIIALGDVRSFLVLTLIFLISILPILAIRHARYGGSDSIQNYIKEGIKLAIGDGRIREVIIIGLIGNFIVGMAAIMFISLVQIGFRLPAIYVSMIFGVLVFGIAIGSIAGSKITGNVGRISIAMYAIVGISFFSISLVKNALLAVPPPLIAGMAMGIENVAVSTSLMRIIPVEMMARIQGAFNTFGIAATAVSSIVGGFLYQSAGRIYSFMIVGFSMILVAVLIKFMRNFSSMIY